MNDFLEVLQYLFSILWIIILIGAIVFICVMSFIASWKMGLAMTLGFLFAFSLGYYLWD